MTEEQFKTLVRELRISQIGIAVMIVFSSSSQGDCRRERQKQGRGHRPRLGFCRGHKFSDALVAFRSGNAWQEAAELTANDLCSLINPRPIRDQNSSKG